MENRSNSFWDWYQRHFTINVSIASFLFLLQLFHLYWLFTDVVLGKLLAQSYFGLNSVWGQFSIFFDYTEVPALVTATFVYLHKLRQRYNFKSVLYLILINSQWLHILWITDEYVVDYFTTNEFIHWGAMLAWLAILIDFLELPVIYDTVKQTILEWRKK
ncbi:MAG: hypothetical protein KW793_02610 [Candidatus Doudnabacteria bacterium]|nr:hypothetical protein [Candidatus Doudnabacteria bacterium]